MFNAQPTGTVISRRGREIETDRQTDKRGRGVAGTEKEIERCKGRAGGGGGGGGGERERERERESTCVYVHMHYVACMQSAELICNACLTL